MKFLNRLVKRHRTADEGEYVCTLCRAAYPNDEIIICPKCRGYVRKRTP